MANYTVVLLDTVRSYDQYYTYTATTPHQIGERVLVPFGPKDEPKEAVIFSLAEELTEVKPIIRSLGTHLLSQKLIDSLRWVEDYYVAPIGALVRLALPKAVRFQVGQTIEILNPTLTRETKDAITAGTLPGKALTKLTESGEIARHYTAKQADLPTKRYLKSVDKLALDDLLHRLKPSQTILRDTIESLLDYELIPVESRVTKRHLETLTNHGAFVVQLPELPLVRLHQEELSLTAEQADISRSLHSGIHLIYGLPASGKTHVLLSEVRRVIASGSQALILVPEQLMAENLARRIESVFCEPVTVLHSRLSDGEIRERYHFIRSGEYQIVVGTRNAVLAPFKNLGLIGIDDFHDDAFYSDEPPVDFRRLTIDYAKRLAIPVILTSSTPDLIYLSDTSIEKHYLANSFHPASRQFQLVDLRQQVITEASAWLSQEVFQSLAEKSLLFLNKIGYASFVVCLTCGEVMRCPNCLEPMMYQQSTNRLQCRLCGISLVMPKHCPSCQGEEFQFMGVGLEKVEEALKEVLPEKEVQRFDSYSLRKKGDLVRLPSLIQDAEILLATQILTKGYEIPGLKNVALLSPDTMLYTPEFRAREKTFQALIQVAGRVGRIADGTVYIQTYTPESDVYQAAMKQDISGFYRYEYQLRKHHHLPPHTHMIKLVVAHTDQTKASDFSHKLAELLRSRFSYSLHGPYQGLFERVGAFYRYYLYLKATDTMDDLKDFLRSVRPKGAIRLTVVVDPLSLLY